MAAMAVVEMVVAHTRPVSLKSLAIGCAYKLKITTMTQIRTVKMYINKMLNKLFFLFAVGLGLAVQADPVDYYEPHLTLSTPIGTIEYGRSLHKGGWAYGYDLFNKPFDKNLLRLKLTITASNQTSGLVTKAELFTNGKGVVERTLLLSCQFTMQWQSEHYHLSNLQCGDSQPASQYLPAKNHLHLGLSATEAEVQLGLKKAIKDYSEDIYAQVPQQSIKNSVSLAIDALQEYIPVRIYDSATGLVYHYDGHIRAEIGR